MNPFSSVGIDTSHGSANLPLQTLDNADGIIENKETARYVLPLRFPEPSGILLQRMGDTSVTNIGGIAANSGKVE